MLFLPSGEPTYLKGYMLATTAETPSLPVLLVMASNTRDYASYPSKGFEDEHKEDIRHIEEVPASDAGTRSSPNTQSEFVPRTTYTGRWGRLRCVVISHTDSFLAQLERSTYLQEPAIPPGEYITKYPNRWSRYRYILNHYYFDAC